MKKRLVIATVLGVGAGVSGCLIGKKHRNGRRNADSHNNQILILVNHEVVIYNFRLELVERLLSDGYEVHISTPGGERVDKLKGLGCIIHNINFDRHGMNPAEEFRILRYYKNLMKEVHPLIVFSYTIKPNIYGAMASRINHIPFVANITGLGTAVENGGLQSRVMVGLYKVAVGGRHGKIQRVFFQNGENERFFKEHGIALDVHELLPGSGVNTERFPYREYPECRDGKSGEPIRFAFISRIMLEKGIDKYLDAAERIKKDYPNTEFHIAGFFEPEYNRRRFDRLVESGVILYDGNIEDVSEYMGSMHCIVHPTYYPEGLSNVLLEAASTGRPIITTDRSGCREVCQDGINGYLVAERNRGELIEAINRFVELTLEQRVTMGKAGRKLVEEKFSRQIVVEKYVDEIKAVEA